MGRFPDWLSDASQSVVELSANDRTDWLVESNLQKSDPCADLSRNVLVADGMNSKPEIRIERDTIQAITQRHRILWGWSCNLLHAYHQMMLIGVSSLTAHDVV